MSFYSRLRKFSKKLSSQYPLAIVLDHMFTEGSFSRYRIEVVDTRYTDSKPRTYSVVEFTVEAMGRKRYIRDFSVSMVEDNVKLLEDSLKLAVVSATRSLVVLLFKSFKSRGARSNVLYVSKFLGI
jgi:hypothetical protein